MSHGPWKRSEPDEVTVEYVPITDEAQLERWYESWRILERVCARMEAEQARQESTPAENVTP